MKILTDLVLVFLLIFCISTTGVCQPVDSTKKSTPLKFMLKEPEINKKSTIDWKKTGIVVISTGGAVSGAYMYLTRPKPPVPDLPKPPEPPPF